MDKAINFRRGSLLLALLCGAPVAAQQVGPRHTTQGVTAPGVTWTYSGSTWSPVDVSIGNRGTQVLVGKWHNLFVDSHAMLLSSHDGDPPAPCWESPLGEEQVVRSDSAAFTDVHVMVTAEETADLNQRIRRVTRSSSQGVDWTYTYPHLGAGHVRVGVSRSGGVIVAAIGNPITGLNDVLVFGPNSAVPEQTFTLPGGSLVGFDLAAKGKHALFAIGSNSYVLDLGDGSLHPIYDHSPFGLAQLGLAISGDGTVVGCNVAGGMALYEWNGADYVQTWFRSVPGDAVVDISDDGTTMAYGLDFTYTSQRIITECVDIPSKTVTMSEDLTSAGVYGNGIEDISITHRGDLFVTASWGDELDLDPEVRVYARGESAPVQTFNLPGSAVSVDVSPDGLWVAAGSYPVHTHVPSNGGRVDLFHLGQADFTMDTAPRIGSTVTFEVFAEPGRFVFLLDSPSMAKPGFQSPGGGVLHLAPPLRLTPIGPIGPDGKQALEWDLPADPSLVGTSHYFQGYSNDPTRRFTRRWLVVTYLP